MENSMFRVICVAIVLCSCQPRLSEKYSEIGADASVRDGSVDICPEGQDCGPVGGGGCDACCPDCPACPSCPPQQQACATLGCAFAPWGWCGTNDTACDGTGQFAADPTQQACERSAMATCQNIGFPISECWITFAQSCSPPDQAAAYKHCLKINHLPSGSTCQLIWR